MTVAALHVKDPGEAQQTPASRCTQKTIASSSHLRPITTFFFFKELYALKDCEPWSVDENYLSCTENLNTFPNTHQAPRRNKAGNPRRDYGPWVPHPVHAYFSITSTYMWLSVCSYGPVGYVIEARLSVDLLGRRTTDLVGAPPSLRFAHPDKTLLIPRNSSYNNRFSQPVKKHYHFSSLFYKKAF